MTNQQTNKGILSIAIGMRCLEIWVPAGRKLEEQEGDTQSGVSAANFYANH